jgi:adenosylhomocysteine nucleosidase
MLPIPLYLVAPTTSEYAAMRPAAARAGESVRLVLSGMGPERVSRACEEMAGARSVALVGWAGAIDPQLLVGDVVVAAAVVNEEGERIECTPFELRGARTGVVLTVATPLMGPEEKRTAWHGGAIAAEMEGFALARWAAQRGVPLVHVRIILDAAGESLPALGDALDPYGRIRPARLVRQLSARPGLVLGLVRYGIRVCTLSRRLAAIAAALVAAGSPEVPASARPPGSR